MKRKLVIFTVFLSFGLIAVTSPDSIPTPGVGVTVALIHFFLN